MPKQVHRHPGIKPLSKGGYQARVSYRGFEESQNFQTLEHARRWQTNMRNQLENLPAGIRRHRKRWHATVIGGDGVTTESFLDLDEARKWLNEATSLVKIGNPPPRLETKIDFSDYALSWLENRYSDKKARKGTYASQLKHHVLPHLGHLDLRNISTTRLQDWIDELKTLGVGIPTIKSSAGAVRLMLKQAHKDGKIPKNPWISIEIPSGKKSKKARAFTEKQLFAIADKCGPFKFLVIFLGHCGLRIGEATALRRKHIDLERNVIQVVEAWSRTRSGKRILGPTKTDESRDVPIPKRIRAELSALCAKLGPDDYLFVGEKNGPLNSDFFRKKWFAPAAAALGINDASVHMLRHTCASILIRLLTPITAVSQILGHSSVEVTLNTYAHFYEEDVVKAMDNLSDHLDTFTE